MTVAVYDVVHLVTQLQTDSTMTQEHPITPAQQLVDKWVAMLEYCEDIDVFTDVARWGADQELEACCEYLTRCAAWEPEDVKEFCDLRRPKPPSLKEQGLKALDSFEGFTGSLEEVDIIRRALESLPD